MEHTQQMRYLQDLFHNPVPFDLRREPLGTSSPPDEVLRRLEEVKYQIDVLQALLVVMNEEVDELVRALPADIEEKLAPTHRA